MVTSLGLQYFLHSAWALFLAFNVFFNYFHCAFTHPGKPKSFLPRNAMSDSEDEETCDDEDAASSSRWRFGCADAWPHWFGALR